MNAPTTYEQLTEKIKLLHPFVEPKDVSIYNDPIYPANPHPKIATIASLMNELYTLFIDMQYIPAPSVSFAPHTTNPISLHHAALFGLEKQVVDLLQMLPYHDGSQPDWNFGSDNGEFLFGGEFDDDLRGKEESIEAVWWRKCVDPLYYLDVDWKGKRAVGWNLRCEDVDDEGEEMGEECEEEEEEEKEGWLMTYNHEDDNEEDKDEDWDDDMTDEDESSSEVSEDDAIESEELLALHQDTIEAEAAEQREAALYAQAEEAERLKRHTLDNDPRHERLLLYLRPWHVTLNKLGNHGTVLFLNTHTFTIPAYYTNGWLNMHGAAQTLIYDNLTTLALAPISKPGFWMLGGVSRVLDVKFLRPAGVGEKVTVEVEVVHVGRAAASLRGVMKDGKGRVLSTCEHDKSNIDPEVAKL
ncbi:hypothetical protein D6D17_03447 [Aureobasidium pullulans]|nr:hypothetical protein D6D17_03447 [Aureobasidium pullulans]